MTENGGEVLAIFLIDTTITPTEQTCPYVGAVRAARIETLCKTLGVPVLVSAPFASAMRGYGWRSLGHHALKDFVELVEVFTLDPFLAGQDGVG